MASPNTYHVNVGDIPENALKWRTPQLPGHPSPNDSMSCAAALVAAPKAEAGR